MEHVNMGLPAGERDALGSRRDDGTSAQIARLAVSRPLARLVAWRWGRAGAHVEALALRKRAGLAPDPRSLSALSMHRAFLDSTPGGKIRGWLASARGLAHLAVGAVDAALPDLAAAIQQPPRWGRWLDGAAAYALLEPLDAGRRLLHWQRHPPAALLLAHLAARAGEAGRVHGFLSSSAWRTHEIEPALLRANLARLENRAAGDLAAERAFAACLSGARSGQSAVDPLISVIVAARDAEATIEAALRSLLDQSWRNIEIVMVDDASCDGTFARADALAATDSRLRILRVTENGGAYAARNAGLVSARGDFIAFHDADDVAHRERLARQAAPLLTDRELAFTTGRWVRRDAGGFFVSRQMAPLVRLHVGSILVRRTFLGNDRFDDVRFGADSDLLLRLRAAAGPRHYSRIRQPLTLAGYDQGSAVHDPVTGYGSRGFSRERQAYLEQSADSLISSLASA